MPEGLHSRIHADPDEGYSPVPQHRERYIYCDDSGLDGKTHYAFGSLWMPVYRRGTLHELIAKLREKHRVPDHEIKWKKIHKGNVEFYFDLVTQFFKVQWMMFHCLLVRKQDVDLSRHGPGRYDTARRKHFAMLIRNKVAFFGQGAPDKSYHVRVDRLPSSYGKADEAAHKIINAMLLKEIGHRAVKTLYTRDSKDVPGIQLADLLLGAVMSCWCGVEPGKQKWLIRDRVAECLGWKDLRRDTERTEWKFNIWSFHDPTQKTPREVRSRPVKLLFPMPKLYELRSRERATQQAG